ncbi:MAG: hypothetical protein HOJ99_01200 [Porticoccaceae bacterium]|nr:hypothetical protein [Porticoccaceae bacterium]MBT5577092.1 hypothetical protein [Porticoccaceae bacterium]
MMISTLYNAVKTLNRWFWLSAALLVIGTVIFVVVGRQTIANVDSLRPDVQAFISNRIGMQVELGKLQGEWPRLVPILDIEKVRIIADDQTAAVVMDHGRANLDLLNSLKYRTTVWRELVVENLALSFAENANGRWALKGFEGGSQDDLQPILDPLFYSRLIRLKQVEVNLEFFSGKLMQVYGDNLQLENDTDFHRAELSLRLSDQRVPAYLLLEGEGDPADLESFHANGYLQLQGFNVSHPVVDIAKSVLPELFANLTDFQANASGEVWFDIHPGGALDFEGNLAISEVPLDWLVDVPPVKDISTQLTGWFTPGLDWGLRLQGFGLSWSDAEIEPLDLVYSQRLGSHWRDFDVSVNHIDLSILTDLVRKTRISTEQILTVMDALRPQGSLSELTLGHNEAGYYTSANLDSVDMRPYKGAPGVKGLSGYLEVQQNAGLFHLADTNGFDVFFPKVYRDYLHIEEALGTVYVDWAAASERLLVRSDPIMTKVEAGTLQIVFSTEQSLPSNGQPPEFSMLIGGKNIDATYTEQYLSYNTPADLSTWLTEAILAGNVREMGMLFRSGPPRNDRNSRTTQLLFDIENSDLNYHPDWLGLRNSESLALIDDGYLESTVTKGTVGQANIVNAKVTYDADLDEAQRFMMVEAEVAAELPAMISLLAQSPLKSNLGALRGWDFGGQTSSQMQLKIPMAGRAGKKLGLEQQGDYWVRTQLNNALIDIPESPILLENIAGQIDFSIEGGMQSDAITASFWQQPLTAKLFKTDGLQKIVFDTQIEPQSLTRLVDFPWGEVLSGRFPVEATLSLPNIDANEFATLQLQTQMAGTRVMLPKPLGKTATEPRALDVTLYFSPQFERLSGRFGKQLVTDLTFSDGALVEGILTFDRDEIIPEPDKLLIAAHLPTTNLEAWQPVVDLFTPSPANQPMDRSANRRLPIFDLHFDQLDVATFKIKDIQARVDINPEDTAIRFNSDLADGLIRLSANKTQVPWVELSRLSLPSAVLQQKIGLQTVDPRRFVAVDLAIESLFVGAKKWGSLGFELRPEISGAAFNKIRGNLFGLRPGMFDQEPPTEFFWSYDGTEHGSRVVGPVGVDNIGDIFTGFDTEPVADSGSGKLVFDLAWQDKPWAISRENLNGQFQIELRDGSFYKSSGGANATLKLVSLLNFANWLRRLQLDFSDVVGQNLSYNSLAGTIEFENGLASLRDPLKMQMPSGRMSMAGNFDLINETVDTRLLATLPVATNLPWVVALVGGLPAAAGVYLTSKLVEKQVDRLSSISYEVTGPWDDIKISVDRIFAAELKATAAETAETAAKEDTQQLNSKPQGTEQQP